MRPEPKQPRADALLAPRYLALWFLPRHGGVMGEKIFWPQPHGQHDTGQPSSAGHFGSFSLHTWVRRTGQAKQTEPHMPREKKYVSKK